MPIRWHVDVEHRVIRIKTLPPFDALDVTAMLDQQLTMGAWKFGTLVDARQVILSASESKVLFDRVRSLAVNNGPLGPVALVTREAVGSAQAYAIRSAAVGLAFEVFWDIPEAQHWLTSMLNDGPASEELEFWAAIPGRRHALAREPAQLDPCHRPRAGQRRAGDRDTD